MEFIPYLVTIVAVLAFFQLQRKWKSRSQIPKSKLPYPPEAAGGLPIIGHLLSFNTKSSVARNLAAMAEKYGPIFALRIGMTPALVVSNWESVKDCFTISDKALSSRPESVFAETLCFGNASMGFAPYGPYWREMRKIVFLDLLSTRGLEKVRHVRVSEVDNTMKELFSIFSKANNVGGKSSTASPVKVELRKLFENFSMNLIVKKVSGMRYNETEVGTNKDAQVRKVFKAFVHYAGQFFVSDLIPIPFLKWLDIGGHIKSMKGFAKELDAVVQDLWDEHTQRRMKSETIDEKDFMDVLLSKIQSESVFGYSRETAIKATVMTMLVAGFDSTSTHLTWLMSLLLNHPHVMKKAQEEIDRHVGKDRWVEESDIKSLAYIQAISKETFRLYPPPISVPRQAIEDCTVGGYLIPKNTLLVVNVWKLHRDPRVWSEPDKFLPERFLNSCNGPRKMHDDGYSLDYAFTPFGSGRRSCPGMLMATQVIYLIVARLLQGFEFTTPSNLPVDMTEGLGTHLSKTTPLEVLIKPRLPNHALYE
ncbi:cytochrome P450 CYP82D47-like [Coffea eugenioides]|uniref:cytochrome P450 CYP82D47-like n=1 Tax=Coffea eugenioides TaxID=49369 RepID=UPI000F6139CA|nr:cytochrome P450 CYP82D47-like [Coffea eugenioides]